MGETAILFIEDNDDDFERVRDAIVNLTHVTNPIIRADNVNAALAKIYNRPPYTLTSNNPALGLIILDLNMPGINGYAFLQSIRTKAEHAHLPILLYSGMDKGSCMVKCIEAGANAFINKSSDIRQLLSSIQSFLPERVGSNIYFQHSNNG